MNLEHSAEHAAFRRELRAFLAGGLGSAGPEGEERFRDEAIGRGYYYHGIPASYGGAGIELDVVQEAILVEELAKVDVPRPLCDARGEMIVGTLLDLGSDDQKERFIRPTLRGELAWCQGYSEPGAGSDLAALQSTATLDGDEWVLQGHKIWTSGAHASQFMFGLFRSEPEAPKHQGISYLLVPMDQPGIEVRPLRGMDGGVDFNEVFFDGARAPLANTVGARGAGWQVSRATLKHERKLIGNPNLQRDQFNAVIALARERRRGGRTAIEDPAIRQRLSEIAATIQSMEMTRMRLLTAEARGDMASIALPMLQGKLYATENGERIIQLVYDLLRDDGLVAPSETDFDWGSQHGTLDYWRRHWFMSLGTKLGGGASNIQRNLIGERGLGLPRDLRAGRAGR